MEILTRLCNILLFEPINTMVGAIVDAEGLFGHLRHGDFQVLVFSLCGRRARGRGESLRTEAFRILLRNRRLLVELLDEVLWIELIAIAAPAVRLGTHFPKPLFSYLDGRTRILLLNSLKSRLVVYGWIRLSQLKRTCSSLELKLSVLIV